MQYDTSTQLLYIIVLYVMSDTERVISYVAPQNSYHSCLHITHSAWHMVIGRTLYTVIPIMGLCTIFTQFTHTYAYHQLEQAAFLD